MVGTCTLSPVLLKLFEFFFDLLLHLLDVLCTRAIHLLLLLSIELPLQFILLGHCADVLAVFGFASVEGG